MNLRLLACFFGIAALAAGCGSHPASPPPGPPATTGPSANTPPIVTPDNSLSAKVVRYNSVGRFVVVSFPVGQMPQNGQTFFLYRAGIKVGQVKITGPDRDNDTVGDLVNGDAQEGDDVREQ